MALEMGMNLVCSVLEEVVMCVCQYLFMSANAQTIHRKKIWYFFGFTALHRGRLRILCGTGMLPCSSKCFS